ncbi:hypothetical protein BC833DRAFT_611396 [Globomyces pollinis-pini]|nr:hypothetical protein BC833DRAFT_611396 [Globomyces pollinis-pini]
MVKTQHSRQKQPNNHTFISLLFAPIIFVYSLIMRFDSLAWIDWSEGLFNSFQAGFYSLLGYKVTYPFNPTGSVLITGASSGIGGHVAVQLAEKGYVVYAGVRSLPDAHRLKAHISPHNQHLVVPVLLDITNTTQVQNAVQSVMHHFGSASEDQKHLIGIINCAAVSTPGPLETISAQDWQTVYQTNVIGPFSVISAFLPLLRQSKGRIINISSANAMTATPMNGVYASSKMALENATDTLRTEVSRFEIAVSLIIPGSIDTASHYHRPVYNPNKKQMQLTPNQQQLYEPLIRSVHLIERETAQHRIGTEITTRAIWHALFSENPKTRYFVGMDSKITRWLRWFCSDRLLDWGYQGLISQFEHQSETENDS